MGKCFAHKTSLRIKVSMLVGLVCASVYLYIGMMPESATAKDLSVNKITIQEVLMSRDTSETKLDPAMKSEPRPINNDNAKRETDNTDKARHIGFLKVHKAASSTMQNIFFRFGLIHGLTFVLPIKNNYFRHDIGILPFKPGGHYDILAVHTNYSKETFDRVLPENSVKIGIVREPFDRMISAAFYYRYKFHRKYLRQIPEKTFITSLVNNPEKYETSPFSYTKNAMGGDFGFPPNITQGDIAEISNHLDLIKKEFKLVLVTERFEESLILMKRYLNWELSDILFVKVNRNAHSFVQRRNLNMKKFRQTCFLDYIIYKTFSAILSEKIAKQDKDFTKEVAHFKSVLNELYLFCVGLKKSTSLVVRGSEWNEEFEVDKDDCNMMMMSENDMLADLRVRHATMNV